MTTEVSVHASAISTRVQKFDKGGGTEAFDVLYVKILDLQDAVTEIRIFLPSGMTSDGIGNITFPIVSEEPAEQSSEDFLRSVRGEGWREDCPDCVGSKFCCDTHHRQHAASILNAEVSA